MILTWLVFLLVWSSGGSLNIVHVGDSYSSGNGARGPGGAMNYAGPSECYRSPTNWGQPLATALGATYTNRACSGGLLQHIVSDRSFDRQSPLPNGSCPTPSYPPEEFFSEDCTRHLQAQMSGIDSTTDVVLVGVGGNDLYFGELVKKCYIPVLRGGGRCSATINTVNSLLPIFAENLRSMLVAIEPLLKDSAKVVLVAYPHVTTSDSYSCCSFSDGYIEVTSPCAWARGGPSTT